MHEDFLKSTSAIDYSNPLVMEKAESLTNNYEKACEKAKSLFYFVRDEIKYNNFVPYHLFEWHVASEILKRKMGYCVSKAVLLVALARVVRIPARLRFADIINHQLSEQYRELIGSNILVYHGYVELHIDGKWIKLDPTFDTEFCKKHALKPVEFDGRNDAFLHPYTIDGKPHIEYIRDCGYYQDVPFKEMLAARIRAYGLDYFERRKKFLELIREAVRQQSKLYYLTVK